MKSSHATVTATVTVTVTVSRILVAAVLGATFAGSSIAQVNVKGDTGIDTSGNARQERAWCMVNTEGTARSDCLRATAAALSEKRRGVPDNNSTDFVGNALARCNIFMGEDLIACQARVIGLGNASGSVLGGGVIKDVVTVTSPAVPGVVAIEPKKP